MGLCKQCIDKRIRLTPVPFMWEDDYFESIKSKVKHDPCKKCGKIKEETKKE